jgi:Na+/proline symporter
MPNCLVGAVQSTGVIWSFYMSLSSGLIAAVALAYMAIMFAIAFYGDRRTTRLPPRIRAWVYSLSLAVYCTSWTFFGAVGQAAEQLWSFLPIYLGPILLLTLAPWVLQKMVMISKQENITSIADFIAARYGKSQSLAVVVALICLVGVLPYIALQLKGIVLGVNLLVGAVAESTGTRTQDTALIVSLILALFTILFGTRNLDATEHHRGMVLAIAFEALVKLFAFLAVGAFVTFGLYDGFDDLRGDDGGDLPAASVPCDRGRKHRAAGLASGEVGVSGLYGAGRLVRGAYCAGRAVDAAQLGAA